MSSQSRQSLPVGRQRKSGAAAWSSGCVVLALTFVCFVLTAANLNLRSSYGRALDRLSRSQAALEELTEGFRNLNLGEEFALSFIPARRPLVVVPPEQAEAGQQYEEDGRYQEHGLAAFMFVQFNVVQISATTFAVLGLTPGIMQNVSRNAVDACEWEYHQTNVSSGSRGRLQVKVNRRRQVWFGETYRLTYSPLLVHCQFQEPVDGSLGGKLFLNVSTFSPLEGDYIRVEALDVAPGSRSLNPAFRPPFKFEYAFCSPPVYGNASARVVRQWLAYHFALFQGKVHFFMYDAGGVNAQLRKVFRSYMDDGLLSVIDLRNGSSRFQAWYNHQVLAINDCFYRSRAVATWVLHFDFDEYLLPNPPHNLSSILQQHMDMPWVTFGSMPHRTELCALQEGGQGFNGSDWVEREHWEIEKAALRRWRPECWHPKDGDFLCLGAHGRRKYAANPRKIINAGIHRVLAPEQGGVHLRPQVATFHHYRGTLDSGKQTCSKGEFRVSTMKAWQATMEESRVGASVPMPGVEEESWKMQLPDVVDEVMLEQARFAKTFARHHLLAASVPDIAVL